MKIQNIIMLFISLGISFLILLGMNILPFWEDESDPTAKLIYKETIIKSKYYLRSEINEKIKDLQVLGKYDEVLALYGNYIGNHNHAAFVLNNCLALNVPVSVVFALRKRESNGKEDQILYNRVKGRIVSTDYGLLGLNSKTFSKLLKSKGKDWLMEPENNIHLGIKHLRYLYDKTGNWDDAVCDYNGRYELGAREHLLAVLEYEREFDRLFNEGI